MTEGPIACTLTGGEQLDRRERWHRLRDAGDSVRIETPTGLRIEFEHSSALERELRELVELERDCCAFATWEVRDTGTSVALEIAAAGHGVEVLHGMFRSLGSSST
jgi:MerR family transcriptional regulator, copper efflux regulator